MTPDKGYTLETLTVLDKDGKEVTLTEKGVTGGTSAVAFSPDAPCARAQIVTFLYRASVK